MDMQFKRAYVILKDPRRVIRNLRRAGIDDVMTLDPAPPPGIHLVEWLHRGFGLATPDPSDSIPERPRKIARRIWIHPGSGGPCKCVDLNILTALLQSPLFSDYDLAITLGEADGFLLEKSEWRTFMNIRNVRVIQNMSLHELQTNLSDSALYIGNDSGISHFAAYSGIPTIIFFVSTDPTQWAPWTDKNRSLILDLRSNARPIESALSCILGRMTDFLREAQGC